MCCSLALHESSMKYLSAHALPIIVLLIGLTSYPIQSARDGNYYDTVSMINVRPGQTSKRKYEKIFLRQLSLRTFLAITLRVSEKFS